jgi:hypothetical protein
VGARFTFAFTPTRMRGGVLLRLLSPPVRAACAAAVAVFLWSVAQFHHPDTGFSSLISIGDLLSDSKVTALRQAPHYVYENSPGYDGAYYVQLALYPTLDNPELTRAIDNLPYRAKRILFCWIAWLLGLGQAAWVVQAHALLNVLSWLALGWLLMRWFPPTTWENFLRWAAVMFSHGVCMSVRHSLVDAPSLLLVALAMRWLEDGRARAGATTLALAGLGKETSLLATAGIDFDGRAPRTWWKAALTVLLAALPLFAWIGYVRWKFGPAEDPGLGNFTLPFAGFVEKWQASLDDVVSPESFPLAWATLATVLALAVQWLFFMLRWRPGERWWRVGAAFALMMAFLATPVWEGYPGASTRVLLPMTLAFNVLVPRGVRWLPVLLLGNLTVSATVFEFSPPHEFFRLGGDRDIRAAVRVVPSTGWYGPERHLTDHWRWSAGRAELKVVNEAGRPITMIVRGQASTVSEPRKLRVSIGERMVWSGDLDAGAEDIRFGVTLGPGETVLVFASDKPGGKVGTDPRDLAFQVANLDIVVKPAAVPR